jgi:hypothetical protein
MNSLIKNLCLLLAFCLTAFTSQADDYHVKDITVEFKRFNSQKIRAYAVDVAIKRGFDKLLENIVPQEYNAKELAKQIDLKKVDIVEKFNITEEVNTKGRYFAKFDIIYSEEKIKKILQEKRIPYTQKAMGRVLLLPIQQASTGQLVLFGELNQFKDALFKALEGNLLIEPVLPKGDFDEITKYNPQNVLDDAAQDEVLKLANAYDTDKALIILLEQNNYQDQNIYQVTMKYRNFDEQEPESFIVLGKTLEQASNEVANKIINLWQTKNLIELNKPKRFVAMINTAGSLTELNGTIKHLESLKMVSSVKIKQLTIDYALVQTDFYGTPQEFLSTAKAKRLNVFKADNNQWMIERVLD